MGEKQISREDIVSLGETLDGLRLPDRQKALLSTIVALGTERLASKSQGTAVVDGANPARSFSDQFASSFAPGKMHADDGGVKIGHNDKP
jgi:hypothetical protein